MRSEGAPLLGFCSPVAAEEEEEEEERCLRRWGLIEREDREGGQTQGITLSNTHTVTGPLQKTQIPYLTSLSGTATPVHSVNGS